MNILATVSLALIMQAVENSLIYFTFKVVASCYIF